MSLRYEIRRVGNDPTVNTLIGHGPESIEKSLLLEFLPRHFERVEFKPDSVKIIVKSWLPRVEEGKTQPVDITLDQSNPTHSFNIDPTQDNNKKGGRITLTFVP